MFEMLAGRSPFDVVGGAENPDQNTEDYLFQGLYLTRVSFVLFSRDMLMQGVTGRRSAFFSSLRMCRW